MPKEDDGFERLHGTREIRRHPTLGDSLHIDNVVIEFFRKHPESILTPKDNENADT